MCSDGQHYSPLSARLRDSVRDITLQHMNSDYVQRVLMTGTLNARNKAVVHFTYKEALDMNSVYMDAFKAGLQLSPTPEERQYFEHALNVWGPGFDGMYDTMQSTVGPIEARVLAMPVTDWTAEYNKHVTDVSNGNSMLGLLVTLLAGYMGLTEPYNYVVQQPGYKSSNVFDLLCYELLGVHKAVDIINKFIDKRGAEGLSAGEERVVLDTFRKTWLMDCRHHGSHYNVEEYGIYVSK